MCNNPYTDLKTLNGSWLSSFTQCSVHPVYNDVIICFLTFSKIFQNIKGISKRISRRKSQSSLCRKMQASERCLMYIFITMISWGLARWLSRESRLMYVWQPELDSQIIQWMAKTDCQTLFSDLHLRQWYKLCHIHSHTYTSYSVLWLAHRHKECFWCC